MSEENSPFRENGNEPLGRSSTIHLPMADSPDAPEGKLSARPDDLACGDASAEILSNSISLDDEESNKSTEKAKVSTSGLKRKIHLDNTKFITFFANNMYLGSCL
jgi:hypothetical protein